MVKILEAANKRKKKKEHMLRKKRVAMVAGKGGNVKDDEGAKEENDEEDTQVNQCLNCGHSESNLKKLVRCSACKSAYFCNQFCQKKCWKVHKVECVFKVEDQGKKGIVNEGS